MFIIRGYLSNAVQSLKQMSLAMNNELDYQDKYLEGISEKNDEVDLKLHIAGRNLKKVLD